MTTNIRKTLVAGVVAVAILPALTGCHIYNKFDMAKQTGDNPLLQEYVKAADQTAAEGALGTLSWQTVYTDPVLQGYIQRALDNNIDLENARLNIEVAHANMQGARMSYLPSVVEMRREKIAKYEDQINNVRNNREFAFLEKEKEFEGLEIELAEKNIRDAHTKIDAKTAEIAHDKEELADNEHILEQKKKELEEIISETRQQEEEIREKAKELETHIDDYTLAAFKRIRKNARNGLGIVTVQRNACGGCFNRIPPQRQLEIRMHKKVIVCEYCGRIMIDSALAGIEEAPKPEATEKKKSRKKEA